MSKKAWIIIIIIAFVIFGFGFYLFLMNGTNNEDTNQYEADRTSTATNTDSDEASEKKTPPNNTNEAPAPQPPQFSEEQISTFSTKIYSTDSARQNNIKITSNTLNGTIVKNGETFSFCNTVGQSTSSKGYQKADIFDNKGNKKKGLGGGNCQISSTLYNAVLSAPGLTVTERHAHSNSVPYIQKGKDAAVSYGSYDLKFVNTLGKDVKIYCEPTDANITVRIVSLTQI